MLLKIVSFKVILNVFLHIQDWNSIYQGLVELLEVSDSVQGDEEVDL